MTEIKEDYVYIASQNNQRNSRHLHRSCFSTVKYLQKPVDCSKHLGSEVERGRKNSARENQKFIHSKFRTPDSEIKVLVRLAPWRD